MIGVNAVHPKQACGAQKALILTNVPFPPLGTQLTLLFPDGRQTSVILKPGESLEAKLKEVERIFAPLS
jgi:hypothetical protein